MTAHDRARAAVLRVLATAPHTSSALHRAVRHTHRERLREVLAELVASGRVLAVPVASGGIRYSLAQKRLRNADLDCIRCTVRKRRPTGTYCGRCLVEIAREAQVAAARPGCGPGAQHTKHSAAQGNPNRVRQRTSGTRRNK